MNKCRLINQTKHLTTIGIIMVLMWLPWLPEFIHLTSQYNKHPIPLLNFPMENTMIEVSDKVWNLGVLFDNNLTFSNHINETCKKAVLAIRSIGHIHVHKYLSLGQSEKTLSKSSGYLPFRLQYSNSLL